MYMYIISCLSQNNKSCNKIGLKGNFHCFYLILSLNFSLGKNQDQINNRKKHLRKHCLKHMNEKRT